VPPDRALILVDEARFGVDDIEGRPAFPFLEKAGEYGGPPADDETAIRELERLRADGAAFVAFAWMAFWWLEHYAGLASHLVTNYPLVLDNDGLKVFRLIDGLGD